MEREALSDSTFVVRMDVVKIADIVDDGHSRILFGCRKLRLRLLDERNILEAPRSKLNEVERKVGILELGSPAIIERLHLGGITMRLAGVRAALIPDQATNRHGSVGRNHSIPKRGCLLVRGGNRSLRHRWLPILLRNHLPVALDIES